MKYNWEDLPKPLNCFTVKNTRMINLNTGKAVSYYSTNTKIVVVQKCVTPKCTYYRTRSAEHHSLNYAFEASAFGLPNEQAPPAHVSNSHSILSTKPGKRAQSLGEKQKSSQKATSSKGGETKWYKVWFKKHFRRKNG